MDSVNEVTVTDIVMKEPQLFNNRKRPLSSRDGMPSFIGSFVLYNDNVFEVNGEEKSKLLLKSSQNTTICCSILEVYPGGKYPIFQKSHMSLLNQTSISVKDPSLAASFLLQKPMLFTPIKGFPFVINYTGNSPFIFEFSSTTVTDTVLSWDVQLERCYLSAPEIPKDFNGDLIVLGILHQEGVVLLGSQRGSSNDRYISSSSILSGNGLVFYANRSSTGRGYDLYLHVALRFQDFKSKNYHYISLNRAGSLPSCFYYNKKSSLKEVALPLSMAKDTLSLTTPRIQNIFSLKILKEMNGIVLASSPVSKKLKTVQNPFTFPQLSTKAKLKLSASERILLLIPLHKGVALS
jgi:hypothetical protein